METQSLSKQSASKSGSGAWILIPILGLAVIAVSFLWQNANARLLELQSESAKLNQGLNEASVDRDLLQQQLSASQASNIELQGRLSKLSKDLADRSRVPVAITMRRSAMGKGMVARFTNYSPSTLTVIARFANPTTQKNVQKTLILNPSQFTEIGYQEGWEFASADSIELASAGFEPMKMTVK